VDVREPAEFQAGALPGALSLPLGKLRERMAELPKDRDIVVYCQVGIRGYLAERILKQNGYRVRNLSGGYVTWKLFQPAGVAATPANACGNPSACGAPPSLAPVTATPPLAAGALKELNVTGLQCPGPIVRIKQTLDALAPGTLIKVLASDSGLLRDLPAWCESTGNPLLSLTEQSGRIEAVIGRGQPTAVASAGTAAPGPKRTTIVMFSNDLDRALAGLIIATGFASLGQEVTIFFTFWGLNVLRKDFPPPVKKDFLSRMFGFMMPRGARKLALSKMHFGGPGTAMMKYVMAQKNVPPLPDLMQQARQMGVKFLACEMAMNIMGIQKVELLDGVETAGVGHFAALAEKSGTTLFI
jgi:peroxiredoxin family protein/TusA-related sulfurtransferase